MPVVVVVVVVVLGACRGAKQVRAARECWCLVVQGGVGTHIQEV